MKKILLSTVIRDRRVKYSDVYRGECSAYIYIVLLEICDEFTNKFKSLTCSAQKGQQNFHQTIFVALSAMIIYGIICLLQLRRSMKQLQDSKRHRLCRIQDFLHPKVSALQYTQAEETGFCKESTNMLNVYILKIHI